MEMVNKKANIKILTLVPRFNIYSSISQQALLISKLIESRLGYRIDIKGCDPRKSLSPNIKGALRESDIIFYHYGMFDRNISRIIKLAPAILIFHNVTPFKYLWKWKPLTATIALLGSLQLRLLPKNVRWIAVSPYNQHILRKAGFKNIEFCPALIDERYRDRGYNRQNIISFIGRITPNKYPHELFSVVKRVAEQLEYRIKLIIIGGFKKRDAYVRYFEKTFGKIINSSLVDVEWFKEPVPTEEIVEILNRSYVYVSLSRHEGFGLPVCEAIACGCPALYYSCGGTESILNCHGSIPVGNEDILVKTLITLFRDRHEREVLLLNQQEQIQALLLPNAAEAIISKYSRFMLDIGSGNKRKK